MVFILQAGVPTPLLIFLITSYLICLFLGQVHLDTIKNANKQFPKHIMYHSTQQCSKLQKIYMEHSQWHLPFVTETLQVAQCSSPVQAYQLLWYLHLALQPSPSHFIQSQTFLHRYLNIMAKWNISFIFHNCICKKYSQRQVYEYKRFQYGRKSLNKASPHVYRCQLPQHSTAGLHRISIKFYLTVNLMHIPISLETITMMTI